jgi:hypothetical protein
MLVGGTPISAADAEEDAAEAAEGAQDAPLFEDEFEVVAGESDSDVEDGAPLALALAQLCSCKRAQPPPR